MVNQVISNIKKWILNEWSQGRSFTMWNHEGKGLRNKKQLAILNLRFISQVTEK